MFDSNDQFFINTVLDKYLDWCNKCMKKTLVYKLKPIPNNPTEILAIKNGKETKHNYYPIGLYDIDKQEFKYHNQVNKVLLGHILKRYNIKDIFGSDATIKKIFKDTVKMTPMEQNIIPCLISIFHPSLNVVKFEFTDKKNMTLYSLVKLNMECDMHFDTFLDDMKVVKAVRNYKPTKKNASNKAYDKPKKAPKKTSKKPSKK
jgi:hypothetical protein